MSDSPPSTAAGPAQAPLVEFLVTGDEVLRGTIADTNTAATASKLYPLGLQLRRTVVVGDRGEEIRRALLEAAARADLCIVSGGLGPTADDLTAACAAQAAGVPLQLDEAWLVQLEERWSRFRPGEPMPENNRRQALLPAGAEKLGNPDGSAPAFALRLGRCTFFFLPGVPREYHRIIDELVLPRLLQLVGGAALATRTLQCVGIAESALDAAVAPALHAHPRVRFGFRTKFPENHLSLAALAPTQAEAAALLAAAEADCRRAIGPFVYGQDGVTFAEAQGRAAAARGETVAVAESCTGGLLGSLLTEVPGSSAWMRGGFIVYSNDLKRDLLGLPERLLAEHGAVSEPVARAMAEAARARAAASWGLAITGVAGPDGGSAEKPVGTVWMALAGQSGTRVRQARFRGDRGSVRLQAAFGALQLLREALAP
jgi:nicotinamide-nucleotide amidase